MLQVLENPMDKINTEFPFPIPQSPIKKMRGGIVPVNETQTAHIIMPMRPMFPHIQKQIGEGVNPPTPDMKFNVTGKVMLFNVTGISMEYNQ